MYQAIKNKISIEDLLQSSTTGTDKAGSAANSLMNLVMQFRKVVQLHSWIGIILDDLVRPVVALVLAMVGSLQGLQNNATCRVDVLCKVLVFFQDQEEDQRGPGERLWKKTVKHVN